MGNIVSFLSDFSKNIWKSVMLFLFWVIKPIRPGLRQINARQFKMTIMERLNALITYFITFRFQGIMHNSEKIGPGYISLVSQP